MTHTLADWAAALSLGLSAVGLLGLVLAFADADASYFDPRPALVESGRVDQLLVLVANARHDAREAAADVRQFAALSLRDAALTAAALLALLFPATGGTR